MSGEVDLVVPKWFLWVVGVCASLTTVTAIPWFSWATYRIMEHDFKVARHESELALQVNQQIKLAESFDAVRAEQIKRSASVATVESLTKMVVSMDERLQRIEAKIERMD